MCSHSDRATTHVDAARRAAAEPIHPRIFWGVVGAWRLARSRRRAPAPSETVTRRLEAAYPVDQSWWSVNRVLSLRDSVVGGVERSLLVSLWPPSGRALLIAATLPELLPREVSPSRESALRAALGSTTARIVRAQVIEMLVLASAGGSSGS